MSEMAKNLHLAAHRNDHATLTQLLKSASSGDVNHQHNHPTEKTSHLIVAIKKRYVECARLLLAYPYINVNLADSPGMTALHIAADEGLADIAKSLIVDHRADVNAKNFSGMTPLVYAAQKGQADIVRNLLSDSRLQDVNAGDNDLKKTALMRACDGGHSSTVQLLLAHPGIDANLQNFQGYTALIFAAMVSNGLKDYKDGHIECVKMLLSDARVDVNIKCKRGLPALAYGYNHAVKSLLSGKRVFGSYPVPVPVPPPPFPPAVKAASATLAPPAVTVTPVVPAAPVAWTPAAPRSLLATVAPTIAAPVAAPVAVAVIPAAPNKVHAQSVPPPPAARSQAGPEPTKVVEPDRIVKLDANFKTADADGSVAVKETNTNTLKNTAKSPRRRPHKNLELC